MFNKIYSKFTFFPVFLGINLGVLFILFGLPFINGRHASCNAQNFNFILYIWFFFGILLFYFNKKVKKQFLALKLSYRILFGLIFGFLIGLLLRYYPNFFSIVGLNSNSFKLLGKIFIDLIKMIIVPLIFVSIAASIIGSKGTKIGKMATNAIILFLVMTTISIAIGMTITQIVKPGKYIVVDKEKLISSGKEEAQNFYNSDKKKDITNISRLILDFIPDNIFKAFLNVNLVQIIFFSAIFAISIKMSKEEDGPIGKMIMSFNEIMSKVSDIVMQFAPFGVFGFTVWLVSTQDLSLFKSLGMVILIVYSGTLFMIYVLYGIFIKFCLKLNPFMFFKKIMPSQFTGFLLASSSAVLPMSLKISEERLGISKQKTSFVIPLGATINMNGSALNLGVNVLFISQVFGMDFTFQQLVYLLILCKLCSVGTAPIPGASIFQLSAILAMINIPVEAIGLVLAIDRILDMIRTVGNITSDILSAAIIDKMDGTLNAKKWNGK